MILFLYAIGYAIARDRDRDRDRVASYADIQGCMAYGVRWYDIKRNKGFHAISLDECFFNE